MLVKPPPQGHSLLVVATAVSDALLRELGIHMGQSIILEPLRDFVALENVIIHASCTLTREARTFIIQEVLERNVSIPIGILLDLLNLASQDADPVDAFKKSFEEYIF